jgi:DNA polymerase-3 subunit chi
MTSVRFIKLDKPERAHLLHDIAELHFLEGRHVVVKVEDDNRGMTLDNFLWTWKRDSFIPHALDNGAVDCMNEPVVITAHERNCNAAQVVVFGNPSSVDFARRFELVYDFAELFDGQKLKESRSRWRQYKDAGFNVSMYEG